MEVTFLWLKLNQDWSLCLTAWFIIHGICFAAILQLIEDLDNWSNIGGKFEVALFFLQFRLRLTCSISPCGNYFAAGSEDGSVHWFDLESGDLLAILSISDLHAVTSISFHPCSHTLVLCSLNAKKSFNLLEFNKRSKEVQGFSLTTFPRTVKTVDSSKCATPTLNKLERIFRKLDLVSTWKTEQ